MELPDSGALPRWTDLRDRYRQALTSASYLGLLARFDGRAAAVKAGEYRLDPPMTPRSLLALWVSGKTVLHELQLIEGWRYADALAKVRASTVLTQTLAADADEAAVMAAVGRPGLHPEGRLFPDTYRFTRGMSDVAFLRNAIAAQDRVLAEEWASRDANLPYDGPEQALVMVAAGLSKVGKVAYCTTYGTFATRRAYDFLAIACARPRSRRPARSERPGFVGLSFPTIAATRSALRASSFS